MSWAKKNEISHTSNEERCVDEIMLFFSGYYEHIKAPGEVTEKVLNYVKVLARPMIMYQNDHPIHWTPVYAGGKVSKVPHMFWELSKLFRYLTTFKIILQQCKCVMEETANTISVS